MALTSFDNPHVHFAQLLIDHCPSLDLDHYLHLVHLLNLDHLLDRRSGLI
jgi:hypothetical protein